MWGAKGVIYQEAAVGIRQLDRQRDLAYVLSER